MDSSGAKDNYSHILKYTGLFGGVQGLNIMLGLVRTKLVAILLGPVGMGIVSLFNSVINFVSQSTNLGISFSAVRNISEIFESGDEQRINHFIKVVRGWSLLAALLGMLVCIAIGPLFSVFSFSYGNHTLHFILLAPVVGMAAITGGETAILKGCRRLRTLAVVQVLSVLSALIISPPIYYFFGISGIIPVFVLMALASMLLTIGYSYRYYPLRLSGARGILGEGMGMVRLGIVFVLGTVFSAAADVIVRSFLSVQEGMDTVGLYNAGYMIAITYAGIVFSAMETDFFPRLSAVNTNTAEVNQLVNRQIEVSLLVVSPMLAALMLLLPILVPLLLSSTFSPVVPMAQVAVLSMFFRTLTLPLAYINLAKSNSVAFLILEVVFAVVFVAGIMIGFTNWGLFGTGIALVAAHTVDFIVVYLYARVKYKYVMSRSVVVYALMELPFGFAVYAITLLHNTFLYVLFGILVVAAGLCFSLYTLHKKTSMLDKVFKHRARSTV